MKGSLDNALKLRLKEMIIEECEKEDVSPEDIDDDIELFSPECVLALDSLDALQVSMGLQHSFNKRIGDPKEFRRIVTTINNLADFVQSE